MISTLNKLPDGTIELMITIPWKRIKKAYDEALTRLAAKVEIKGFRKGKAPKKLVEEKINKTSLYEEILKELVPQVYLEAAKEQKIKPIISPQIKILSSEEGKDWQIKATTCELPEVSLGDYKGEIKKILAKEKIWVPGTAKTPQDPQNQKNDKLEKIFKKLLEMAQVQIPAFLIQEEVNRMLARLINQTNKLGLTIEQYLASMGKTSGKLREEYQKQAEDSLKLELILFKIANEEKIEIPDAEIEKMIEATPDEKIKKSLRTPSQKAYIGQLLRKRRVIDNLLKL